MSNATIPSQSDPVFLNRHNDDGIGRYAIPARTSAALSLVPSSLCREVCHNG
jgi:hypothetical protein